MKYILCIDKGSPDIRCTPPEQGVVYQVERSLTRPLTCSRNGRLSNLWYYIKGSPYVHTSLLFEDLPEDFLVNLKKEVLETCNI
jgi:hypothetical protein